MARWPTSTVTAAHISCAGGSRSKSGAGPQPWVALDRSRGSDRPAQGERDRARRRPARAARRAPARLVGPRPPGAGSAVVIRRLVRRTGPASAGSSPAAPTSRARDGSQGVCVAPAARTHQGPARPRRHGAPADGCCRVCVAPIAAQTHQDQSTRARTPDCERGDQMIAWRDFTFTYPGADSPSLVLPFSPSPARVSAGTPRSRTRSRSSYSGRPCSRRCGERRGGRPLGRSRRTTVALRPRPRESRVRRRPARAPDLIAVPRESRICDCSAARTAQT